jgi:hypothetical protein
MTTATGDVVYNFKGIEPADQNPYDLPAGLNGINGPFILVEDADYGSALKMSFSEDGIAGFLVTNPSASGTLVASVEQQNSSAIWGDTANPALLDVNGNGYIASGVGGTFYIYRVNAWVVETSASLASGPVTWAKGDVTSISRDMATGSMSALLNGDVILSATDNVYTAGLAQGYLGVYSNNNEAGILSFGASGLAAASEPTNPGLRIKLTSRSGSAPADATGFQVVVRPSALSEEVLFASADHPISSGQLEIDQDSLGPVGTVVHVSIAKHGATLADDINAAGRATVVDLLTEDES